MSYQIVVLVENLDASRYFYREVLKLGPVTLDSNYRVVFELSSDLSLVLEKCTVGFMEHASGATRFAFECEDVPALDERLKKDGCALSDPFEFLGRTAYRGNDPDGNVFLVIGK